MKWKDLSTWTKRWFLSNISAVRTVTYCGRFRLVPRLVSRGGYTCDRPCQAFVDSMMFSRTLIHCQKRLPEGDAPDAGLVLEWARQFEVCAASHSASLIQNQTIYHKHSNHVTSLSVFWEVIDIRGRGWKVFATELYENGFFGLSTREQKLEGVGGVGGRAFHPVLLLSLLPLPSSV